MRKRKRIELGLMGALALSLALGGCGSRKKEGQCKGFGDCPSTDYECVDGECILKAKKDPATSTPQKPAQGTQPPAAVPVVIGPDGLPEVIPPPGSAAPTVAEWSAVTREVTVKGSSALGCETKMLREWLRVSCRKNGPSSPIDVRTTRESGQQSHLFHTKGSLTSLVVQVVRGKDYSAEFIWDQSGRRWTSNLTVSWPTGAPRPTLYFDR